MDVDDRQAVEVLEASAQRDDLQQVGHDADVDDLAVGVLDEPEHLDVLLERQRDVEVIDLLALQNLRRLVEGAEQRQAAVAEVSAAFGTVVDEADHLQAEFAVLEDAIDDEPAEVARAGDEHALEADAGAPAAFHPVAHGHAGQEREPDVEDRGTAPTPAG